MARKKTKSENGAALGFEEKLWLAADKLRGSMDASEYKYVDLGLVFMNYIADAFEEQHAKVTPRFRCEMIGYANGTTLNMLPPDGLKRPRLLLPPAELVRRFTECVTGLSNRAEANDEENRSLAVTRDALLPRLLSGEVLVNEADASESALTKFTGGVE